MLILFICSNGSMLSCPRCGISVTNLHPVDQELQLKIEASGEVLPTEICLGCINDLSKLIANSSGGVLLAQARAKEQHRLNLWKSRVALIRKARAFMNQKMFSEAAVDYEKYLKILEIVFECKKGELIRPQMFKESARTSELTVVTSIYWDLIRIYDSNPKYYDRQLIAAQQLAKFVQYTPIFPDVIKRAESFVKVARNPAAVRQFLKLSADERPRCFIASAAFENSLDVNVISLRVFRDRILKRAPWGRSIVFLYYKFSPSAARWLDSNPAWKPFFRFFIKPLSIFAAFLVKILPSKSSRVV